ncbi:hypothetical protein V8C34DRAFT_291546 [Trichoderma compactum]
MFLFFILSMLSFQGQDGGERICVPVCCIPVVHSLYCIRVQHLHMASCLPNPQGFYILVHVQRKTESPWQGARTTGPASINPRQRVCTCIYRYGACTRACVPSVIVCWGWIALDRI